MDQNTAHRNLSLLDNNILTDDQDEFPYRDHSDRFHFWYQLLCVDGLRGRCYWEVNWIGHVSVGVAYRGIRRSGSGEDSCVGGNQQSWTLDCSPERFSVWHDNRVKIIKDVFPFPEGNRVALYLDWPAGTVSFYKVHDSSTFVHIHTFHCSFTEALHPAFRIRSEFTAGQYNLVSLCRSDQDDGFHAVFSLKSVSS